MKLSYDGHGLNDLHDEYAARVLTFAKNADGQYLLDREQRQAVADSIVQPFNAHTALVKALDATVEIMVRAIGERLPVTQGTLCEEEDWQTALRQARAALAQAKGE